MREEMLSLAERLGGEGMDQELLSRLCSAAEEELTGRLKDGLTPEDCGDAFALAGAWLALAGLYAGEQGAESFTAGELTIRRADGAARGAALRLQAEQVMRPYLRDDGFVFRGVSG